MATNNGKNATPQDAALLKQKADQLKAQISTLAAVLMKKETDIERKKVALSNLKAVSTISKKPELPFFMTPGNVGDVNSVLWPFYFTTERVIVPPASQINAGFSVTQEAAFVMIAFTKAVFLREEEPALNYTYLDPDAPAYGGKAQGLSFTFRDSQSTREFVSTTLDLDHVGNPRFPTYLPAPMLMLPNSNLQITWNSQNNEDQTFVPFLTFFGYRIRIEDAKQIYSLVGEE